MADGIQVKVDTTSARLKLNRVPVAVRDNLRSILPPLIRRLADRVNVKLGSELKTRASLNVAQEMHESANQIYGVARMESEAAKGLLPTYLEEGTVAHEIFGNPVLAFQWDFLGAYGGSASAETTQAFFRHVHHPGTRAYQFMQRSFNEMKDEIVEDIRTAAKTGAQSAR